MRYETAVVIDAPPEAVWEVVRAVERWPEWTPTMRSVRLLDSGGLAEGAAALIRQPRMPAMTWHVTEFTAGESFTWTTERAGLRMTAGHRVLGGPGGGTAVTLDLTLTGPAARVLGPVVRPTARRFVDMEARSLRAHCERSGTA